ncbi:MAG: cell wall-binding repeat-containing protein, partial [Finegoldia magna]|nr:cell wall-binding repeat-containing protein [Finegoldia magna]
MLIKKLQKVTIAMLVTAMILPLNVSQAKSQNVYRISGRTRIATSAEISKSVYSTSENVVLASGYNFADALSAGQLASALDAPLLLSSKDKLDSETEGEINRLKAKNVYIVGGNLTIKKSSIDSYLKKKNIKVTRLEGNNRYKTSEKVMEKTKEFIN